MGKGRPRKDEAPLARVAEVVGAVVEGSMPTAPRPETGDGTRADGHDSTIVRSGQADRVVWLKLCAYPHTKIAEVTGFSRHVIDRYVTTSHYAKVYEARKAEMLGKVGEAIQHRLQEVGMEALATRVELMRTCKNKWLRDKIASDLVKMAIEASKAKGGEVVGELLATVERIKRRRQKDGTVVEERARFSGPASQAEAEAFLRSGAADAGGSDDEAGGGEGAENLGGEGEVDRDDGARQVEGGAGSEGGDGGDGGGGVRPGGKGG